jgi:hypothetical protein
MPVSAEATKYLSVFLDATGSLLRQMNHATGKGTAALHKIIPVLESHKLHVHIKTQANKTHLMPAMQYGMEVWQPNSLVERKQMKKLDDIDNRAIDTALGVHDNWRHRQALRHDVAHIDLEMPTMQMGNDTAHLRYDSKLQHDIAASMPATCVPPLHIRMAACASVDHRWKQRVTLLQQQARGALARVDGLVPDTLSNDSIIKAVWTLYTEDCNKATNGSQRTRTRPRRSQLLSVPTLTLPSVTSQGQAALKRTLQRMPACKVLPILAVRSGHLLDDFLLDQNDTDCCPHCAHPLHLDTSTPASHRK